MDNFNLGNIFDGMDSRQRFILATQNWLNSVNTNGFAHSKALYTVAKEYGKMVK